MNAEKRVLTKVLCSSNYLQLIAGTNTKQVSKSSECSVKARREGNLLFLKNDHSPQVHEEIFRLYCKSIALAPNESEELALAYGNRSALLYHLQKYEESILDIERALKITLSNSLKEKLFLRKTRCLNLLHKAENQENESENIQNNTIKEKAKQLCRSVSNLSLQQCIPKLSEDKNSLMINLKEKEKEYCLNSVSVRFNGKYGRHLIATRNINPGEIIFVEKPYVSCLNIKKHYIYCCHCLSVAWTGIPCNNCSWFIFCSEKCKEDACKEYHDVECTCVPYIAHFLNFLQEETKENVIFDTLSIRALIKGVKEVGSIEKLKAFLLNIDNSREPSKKGFSESGIFDSSKFGSLYSLSCNIPSKEMKSYAMFAAVALICLAKYTLFFGKKFELSDIEELVENSDTIFVGSLLLKLCKISHINSYGIVNVNEKCKYSLDQAECRKSWCCVKGVCIAPTASLINNSCNPNARRCFSKDSRYILYALQPIKKNSQVCDSYYCSFYESNNTDRKNFLEENFYFQCDCDACVNNWPSWTMIDESFEKILNCKLNLSAIEKELGKEFLALISSIERKSSDFDPALLQDLSKAIEKSAISSIQPSIITCKLIFTLIHVFQDLYGYKSQSFN